MKNLTEDLKAIFADPTTDFSKLDNQLLDKLYSLVNGRLAYHLTRQGYIDNLEAAKKILLSNQFHKNAVVSVPYEDFTLIQHILGQVNNCLELDEAFESEKYYTDGGRFVIMLTSEQKEQLEKLIAL